MLLNRWHEFGALWHRKCPAAAEFIGMYRRIAQRFQFTDEATAMAAMLLRDYPDLLLRNYQFAEPPYPTTYVEYSAEVFAENFGLDKYKPGSTDGVVGHLIHNGVVSAAASGKKDTAKEPPVIVPWMYSLGADAHDYFARTWGRKHRMSLIRYDVVGGDIDRAETCSAAVVLGSLLHNDRAHVTDEVITDIHNRVQLWFPSVLSTNQAAQLIPTFTGELRTLWQLLLFINQPQHVQFDNVAASRRMVGSTPTAFPSYRLVRIKPKTTVHHISKAMRDRMKPGLHEVRAFWRNFEKDERCEHDWPLLPDEEGVFQCRKCTQWRVRVKQHARGDPSRPVVRKGYQV